MRECRRLSYTYTILSGYRNKHTFVISRNKVTKILLYTTAET